MFRAPVLLVMLLSACATETGVVPTGPDTYMIGKAKAGCPIGSSGEEEKADAYRQAGEFCSRQGKQIQTIKVTSRPWRPFVGCASAELEFRCISKD